MSGSWPRWMFLLLLLWLEASGLAMGPVTASEGAPPDERGSAVFLFEYEPRAGMQAQFEDGYRRHLDWHRAAKDPLDWHAWVVFSGPRAGRFVNGVFHVAFRDLDERTDPAGDRADFARNVAPFARPAGRRVYRWRPDLSTARRFDSASPAAMAEVSSISLRVGSEARFEQVLKDLRSTLLGSVDLPLFAFYQLVSGGERPSYMLLIPRHRWSEYDRSIGSALGIGGDGGLDQELAESIVRIQTETWGFREDLTYHSSQ